MNQSLRYLIILQTLIHILRILYWIWTLTANKKQVKFLGNRMACHLINRLAM